MGSYGDVFWGIVSAFVAFLLGLVWQRLTRLFTNFRARRFWRSLVGDHLSVVLGRFRDLPGFEASGVVGAGDNIALKDLADYFARIGFKRFRVFYNDQFGWNGSTRPSPLRGNLILIGGPDANSLTRQVLERVQLGIEFVEVSQDYLEGVHRRRTFSAGRRTPEWRVPAFLDKDEGQLYGPVKGADGIRSDCGVIIRCPNPFNNDSEVMIFCGSYGYGSWAAVQYAQSTEFLTRIPKQVRFVECILTVDVVREMPQKIRMELLRTLDIAMLTPNCHLTVPRILEG